MALVKNPLTDLLVQAQILSENDLKKVLEEQRKTSKPLLKTIVDLNLFQQDELRSQIRSALELQYGVSFVNLKNTEFEDEMIHLLPRNVLATHKFVPLRRSGNLVTVAMVDPANLMAEKELAYRFKEFKNLRLKKVVVVEDDFWEFLDINLPEEKEEEEELTLEEDTEDLISSMGVDLVEVGDQSLDVADLADSAEEAPIIQLANRILGVAISRGVSDIHIEPQEKELQVRFRQDGVLTIYRTFPRKIQNAIISRYKIMSELDIAERRMPQDGRIRVRMAGKVIDFRVSTLPSKFGEKIVMRILDKSNISFGLDQLITHKPTLKAIREVINQPFGIIFVTGPTGSGKTTTLYSALSERNTPGVNISTAEDPIEYDLAGITQSEVNKIIGLDFARILRAFLRQDPDIMLVGETRDKETAKIAVEAALTGHLVFTTLHTNDAPGAIMRLSEMDVEPFLISSSTLAIIAQRLLRRVCSNCKEEYEADDNVLKFLGIEKMGNKIYFRGKGCDNCNGSGYKGRVGVYEFMRINDHLRDLIAKGSNTAIIRHAAQESGMMTLLEYSLGLARDGHTTLDEVIRVTFTGEGAASMCANCGKPVGDEFYKCPFCQYDLKQNCPRCSALIQEGWTSCAKCGLKIVNFNADTECDNCGGEISLEMSQCPWCFVKLELNNDHPDQTDHHEHQHDEMHIKA
jgi:type IV pilus assembly protein PilB